MLRTLKIENFRRFKRFELHGLGRVNLLVGLNNSGKTSVLEAVHLLAARDDLASVYAMALRRGERLIDDEGRGRGREIDICRLFHGYELSPKMTFRIDGRNGDKREWVKAEAREEEAIEKRQDISEVEQYADTINLNFKWGGQGKSALKLQLSPRGGLPELNIRRHMRMRRPEGLARTVRFVESSSLSVFEVVSLFDEVVLTPEESIVVEALRIIEPSIERIASIGAYRENPNAVVARIPLQSPELATRGGIVVRCSGSEQRIPIGTMGDGIWRLLGLALALVRSEGGILLVDEIDTGLHYTVMSDMWRMVHDTAIRTNTQVFATTHNSDCWTSLASVIESEEASMDVSIQRIEPDKGKATAFSHEEIVIAAERGIEVR